MATTNFTVGPDNTTLALFEAWAMPISAFWKTAGWVQANDTGQVVWTATVLTCTSVAVSGGNAVYAFASYTGPDPRIGMSFTFSTFANGGNNVTATVTALTGGTGGGAGTVTVVLSTQVTDTTGSGTTTALAARPGIGATVYEVWVTGDVVGFPVYVKFEYGTNSANANSVAVFATI